jgi:hypothetical protein
VANKQITLDAKRADDGLGVVGHRGKIVAAIRHNGAAPAALVSRDAARDR